MTSNMAKRAYVPPQARDLSSLGVQGDDVHGGCKAGLVPHFNCLTGPAYVASCTGGSGVDTSSCTPGGYHTYPTCTEGAVASTTCISGATQN